MKITLILAVLACALAVGQSQSILKKAVLEVIRIGCAVHTMVDPAMVLKVRQGDFSVQDPKMEHYAFCIYRTLMICNDDGSPNKEMGLKLIGPETDPAKFSSSIDACMSTTGANPHNTLWNFLLCYNQQYPGDISAI